MRAKSFDSEAAAKVWAKVEHARLRTGIAQAGRAPIAPLIDDYIKDKKRTCSSAEHVAEIERVLRSAVAAGVTDIRSDSCVSAATDWLLAARALHRRVPRQDDSADVEDDEEERPRAALSPATLNRMLATLSTFGNWCVARRHSIHNPFASIERVAGADLLKATFSLDEMRLLVSAQRSSHPFHLSFVCMAYLGLRQGEAANIDWSWFLWRERMVRVTWSAGWKLKRQKERLVPMPMELEQRLRSHAQLRGLLKGLDGEDPISRLTGPLNPALVGISRSSRQQRFNGYLQHCGVAVGDRTPHSTRHTWISVLLATGEPETLVRLYAGHEKMETTSEYARSMVQYRRAVEGWGRGELRLAVSA